MDIIVLRHAERTPGFAQDPQLTPHGREQAIALADILMLPRWGRPHKLYASPKQRALQTLQPLAEKLDLPVEILPDLDEKQPGESVSSFRERIQNLIDVVTVPTQVSSQRNAPTASLVWCSHLDWIEEFRSLIDCEEDLLRAPYDQWSPGQFLVLRPVDLWKVVGFGRAP